MRFVVMPHTCVHAPGHGITQTAAQKGFNVVAVESHAPAMEKGVSMIKGSLSTIASKMEKKGELEGVRPGV